MATTEVNLSINKFLDLMRTYDYILVSVYCENDKVIFFECRSPKYQKTFIIYISKTYSIKIPDTIKKHKITLLQSLPSPEHIEFLSNINGPLLECDLVSISSSQICIFHNSGDIYYYLFGDNDSDIKKVQSDEENENENEVDNLIKNASKVLHKIDPNINIQTEKPKPKSKKKIETLPFKKEEVSLSKSKTLSFKKEEDSLSEPKSESKTLSFKKEEIIEEPLSELEPESNKLELEPKEKETEILSEIDIIKSGGFTEKVELIFETDEGEKIDDTKSLVEGSQVLSEPEDVEEDTTDDEQYQDQEYALDNSIPSNIEDNDIDLGIIYITIGIGPFYKKIKTFEDEMIKMYNQLDENEVDFRKNRLKSIKESMEDLLEHSHKRLNEIHEEENNLKYQLMSLSVVLIQTTTLKKKIESKPEKYGEDILKVEKIYNQTRKTAFNINLELLRLRDQANELLYNYKMTINELMEL